MTPVTQNSRDISLKRFETVATFTWLTHALVPVRSNQKTTENMGDEEFKIYKEDRRMPCRFGTKCKQKTTAHREQYKHPPGKDDKKNVKRVVGKKRKKKESDDEEPPVDSPKNKIQKQDVNDATQKKGAAEGSKEDNEQLISISEADHESEIDEDELVTVASLLKDCDVNLKENEQLSIADAHAIIQYLFQTKMPPDFFLFYEYCKSINEKDPLNAMRKVGLQLVGPYDVFNKTFLSSKVKDKKCLLRHWRYYYDPPEFQTVVKASDPDELHFGYWRDDAKKDPVFVAKNSSKKNCEIVAVGENIFSALFVYLTERMTLAGVFEHPVIGNYIQGIKKYGKTHSVTVSADMSAKTARQKKVVAKTFHKAGIVVPYDKSTEQGYRELALSDSELKKLLIRLGKSVNPEEKNKLFSKLEEVIRLATIAADECDFGTCLELGHDLFCSGVSELKTKALQMLSLAYNLLKRPEFLEIAKAHLECRKKGQELSVFR